jgi:Lon protease-like protein
MISPMFPLSGVFVPSDIVSLRIFEPRYVAMCKDILAGQELVFGTVMITAGSEVGGDDRRGDRGTLVSIEEMFATDDGGYVILGRAGERCSIETWLPDDPYPIADITALGPLQSTSSLRNEVCDRLTMIAQRVRSLIFQLAEQRGISMEPLAELTQLAAGQWGYDAPDDARIDAAFWSLIRHTPCGPQDRYALLRARDLNEGLVILERVLEHIAEVIAFQTFPPNES